MGKERAIIFLGTAIASLAIVLGAITVFPTIDQVQTQSTAMTINGHWTLTIADADGTVKHYMQMDNFPTDDFKDKVQAAIAQGTAMGPFDFVGGCVTTAATAFNQQACATEMASGRCDAGDGTTGDVDTFTAAASPIDFITAAVPSEFTKACEITIVAGDDNLSLTDLFIADNISAGTIANFATLATSVTIFETQILTVTVDFDIN